MKTVGVVCSRDEKIPCENVLSSMRDKALKFDDRDEDPLFPSNKEGT
jgi:hypothetical protein